MLMLAFGTRPEWLKIKPLIKIFNENNFPYRLLFTGQHVDLIKDIPIDYKIEIEDGYNRLDSIIKSTMNALSNEVWDEISHVLVQGDTTSVLAVALSAFNRQKKVIHLEAGLRTYDNENPYPEEQNRRLVAQITDIHLCPTDLSYSNLLNERIDTDKYVVGNTVLDNLLEWKDNCVYNNKVLITMHRRENHYWLDEWFRVINNLAKEYTDLEFIIPLHPNPNVQKHKHLLTNVNVIEPLEHNELLGLLSGCKLVITDSGGIQEECSFFNKKCLVCRKETERPEALDITSFLIDEPNDLYDSFKLHIDDFNVDAKSPYGDGHSSEKILEILKNIIK